MRINAQAPGHLAAAASAAAARLVHVSTDFVFDGTSARPYLPGDPVNPLGVYGASKRAGEEAVLRALPGALILRPAWVYGATGTNFVQTLRRLMRAHGRVSVVADQVGTPTPPARLAHSVWSPPDAPSSGFHHFTVAGSASRSDFA